MAPTSLYTPPPLSPGPHGAGPVLGTLAVGAGSVIASGMASWTPAEWAFFFTIVSGFVGTIYKLHRDHIKLRTEVRQDVQAGLGKVADVAEKAAAANVPDDQLDDLADRIAARMAKKGPPSEH